MMITMVMVVMIMMNKGLRGGGYEEYLKSEKAPRKME